MTRLTTSFATRYTFQGMLALGAVGLGVWGVLLNIGGTVQAQIAGPNQETERALDPVVYSHVHQVRDAVGLTSEDLAALALSPEACEAVLSRLADWCEANQQRLDDAERTVYVAEREVESLRRKIRTGQASLTDLEQMAEMNQAVFQAQDARTALMREGGTAAMQDPSAADKLSSWQQASQWVDILPVGLRHLPSMSSSRLETLRSEAARTETKLESALSYRELQQLAQIRANVKQYQPIVRAAEAVALPLPDELRETASRVGMDLTAE